MSIRIIGLIKKNRDLHTLRQVNITSDSDPSILHLSSYKRCREVMSPPEMILPAIVPHKE